MSRYFRLVPYAFALSMPCLGCADAPDAKSLEPSGDLAQGLAVDSALPEGLPGQHILRLEHFVDISPGRRVHVTEAFTIESLGRTERRAVLLLPGTLVTASFYNIDVDGYRFQDVLAERGFFAFAIDFEGTGQSSRPADGYSVTHDFLVEEGPALLEFIRTRRHVARVDVLGESNGGAVAAEICADRDQVRSCTLVSMLYRTGTAFFDAVFNDPGFLYFLSHQPNGYLEATPELYFNITLRTTPEVREWILATQPGSYAAQATLVATSLPWFDPTHAAVPGLVIQGTEDNIAEQSDADDLAAAYGSAPGAGGVAKVVRIEGAGHIPRIEPPPLNQQFVDIVLQFLAEN